MKKLCVHISFYNIKERIQYLNEVVNSILNYDQFDIKDIFIHTNSPFEQIKYTNQIVHDCSNIHPYFLTWLHRPLLKTQINDYDFFMYIEDDIVIKSESIDYWMEYDSILTPNNFELGFLRIETDNAGNEYVVDLLEGTKHNKRIFFKDVNYVWLTKNYKGFWIYNKNEMIKFAHTENFETFSNPNQGVREQSARGMQDENNTITLIPLIEDKLDERCKVYHITNNYYNNPNTPHGKVNYKNCI